MCVSLLSVLIVRKLCIFFFFCIVFQCISLPFYCHVMFATFLCVLRVQFLY